MMNVALLKNDQAIVIEASQTPDKIQVRCSHSTGFLKNSEVVLRNPEQCRQWTNPVIVLPEVGRVFVSPHHTRHH